MRASRGRPLLGHSRAWAGLTLAVCALLVAAIGLLFNGQTGPDQVDNAVDSPVIAFLGGRRTLLPWLAAPGTLIPAVVISAAIVVGCLVTRRFNGAVLAATAVAAATGLADGLLKHLFHRTYLGQISFPSGHTASAAALTATLAVLFLIPPQQARTRAARVTLVVLACVITVIVAAGVMALRWHYFTDCVAGAAVGTGAVLTLAFLIDLASAAISRTTRLAAADPARLPKEVGPAGRPGSP